MRYCSIHLDVLRDWNAIVPPDSGRFGLPCNSSGQGPWAPSRPIGTRRPFFRLVKTIDPHYLGVVDYVTGRWCPTSAGLKPPLSPAPASRGPLSTPRYRAPAIYSPSPVTQRRELRHRGVASCPSTWQLDARAIRHPRHPFLSTPSRRLRVIVVFTISISHLIRYARATGIKYHSADSTSVFLLIPSSSCPSPVTTSASQRRGGRRGEFKDICAMPPVMFTILQCDVNSGNER